jgi:hypothetical protein
VAQDDTRFYFDQQGQPPYATGIPDYLDLADEFHDNAVQFFAKGELEHWVDDSLDMHELAAAVVAIRVAHPNDAEGGWEECYHMLEEQVPWREWIRPEWVVRQVTEAVQVGEDQTPAIPTLPFEIGDLGQEGDSLVETLLAVVADEIRDHAFAPPTDAEPAGQYLNAAILALVDRGLAAGAQSPAQSPTFTPLQTGLATLVADPTSVIGLAVRAATAAYVTANAVAIVAALRAELLTALVDELGKTPADSPLVRKVGDVAVAAVTARVKDQTSDLRAEVRKAAAETVPTVKPAANSELIKGIGELLLDGAANNDLRANLDTRIVREVQQPAVSRIIDPAGAGWQDPR